MAEPAFKRALNQSSPAHEPIQIRRFELPDLSTHGAWVSERLREVYPHLTQQTLYGWLNSLLYNPEFLFLYQDNAVALAQAMNGHTLSPKAVIHERFVLVQDRKDSRQIDNALAFYGDFVRWAKAKDADAIILADSSDVPPERLKEHSGLRLFSRQYSFLKV